MALKTETLQTTPSTRLLTPDASGARLLWEAVQHQLSLRASPLAHAPLQTVSETEQRIYCESSGSTGAPKLIRRNPASWRVSFEVNAQHFGIGSQDTYAVLGHLGHSLSLYAALEAFHLGGGLVLLADLGPKHQALALRQHKVTTIYATPSQLRLITQADPETFPKVARILVGGGVLYQDLRDLLAHRFPAAHLVEFFGASETSFVTISDELTPSGSVGRAYPGVSLRIADGKTPGETGEIWVKSPYLFDGYEQGDSPLTRWRDGYLSIGELGRLDPAGYLYLQGRKSRMVTVADQNVFPEAIEDVLLAQPKVDAAAVITPRDEKRGFIVVAAVVGDACASDLRNACRARLGDAAVPRNIWQITHMPMLLAGKPDLQNLEALWLETNR